MPIEPVKKRVFTFFDGQNLFHSLRECFGCTYPDYDPVKLSRAIVSGKEGWELERVFFYTGVPDESDNSHWNHFWNLKLAVMGTVPEVKVFSRSLKYQVKEGVRIGHEKGIDVRIALDVTRMALEKKYDVAILFSQDQDLSEIAHEIRDISETQERWIKIVCAFPHPNPKNSRGINRTEWLKFDKKLYENCKDPRDYRKKGNS